MDKIGGKYEVIRKLGDCTTSTVYLAYDPFAITHRDIKPANNLLLVGP